MGQFTIKEQTNSATYEYKNDEIIVNGNFQKDGTTGDLKNINGTCYDNNDGEPGRYIGNFSGYMRDGEVRYEDDGKGPGAYLGHTSAEDTLVVFGKRLQPDVATKTENWSIRSKEDKSFTKIHPLAVWRKSKPMNTDHTLTSELDHWLFLHLPGQSRCL